MSGEAQPYDPSKYNPHQGLLRYWELRRRWNRIANDVVDVHWTCRPFFDEFDPKAVVYVHGSFARGLQGKYSDVNLYIASCTRKTFHDAWSASPLQKPRRGDPNAGVSVSELLGEEMDRRVSICCQDDAGFWVDKEVKVRIYPFLPEGFQQSPIPLNKNPREHALNVLRKCWYKLQRSRLDKANESVVLMASDCISQISVDALTSPPTIVYFRLVCADIIRFLETLHQEECGVYFPELSLASLINQLKDILREVEQSPKGDIMSFWTRAEQELSTINMEISGPDRSCGH